MTEAEKAFDAYVTYVALKSHFTTESYNYIERGGRVKANIDSLMKRRDKYFFLLLARKKNWFEHLLANMIANPNYWIGDIVNSEECQDNYKKFLKRVQSLTYNFKSELAQLDQNFDSNFRVKDGQHPPVLRKFLKGEISPETLIILDDLIGCFKYWNANISDTIVWPDIFKKSQNYKPFLSEVYDKEKMKRIVVEVFQPV